MFNKKKPKATETIDTVCKVCGVDCFDQNGLDRHVTWAHGGSQTPAAAKDKVTEKSEKKG